LRRPLFLGDRRIMMLVGFAGLGFAGYRAERKGRGSIGVSNAH
jgi:hypothetical protein